MNSTAQPHSHLFHRVSTLPATPDPRPEFALIDWLRTQAGAHSEIPCGIGDDCAVLNPGNQQLVICKDVLAEGTHFTAETPPDLIGRKALAVNLSDIAAMAAQPMAAFVGLVLPRSRGRAFAERVSEGVLALAREWNVSLAGGDTNSWDGPLVISVTVVGTLPGPAVTRAGALPGDWIMVTGPLGGSLQSGRHLTFTPRISEALALRELVSLHAMIDLSDGLAGDLFHILRASSVGAKLFAEAISIHSDVPADLPFTDRLQHALRDGEDFELLFTVSPADGSKLLALPDLGTPIARIGEIVAGSSAVLIMNGEEQPLSPAGYSHSL